MYSWGRGRRGRLGRDTSEDVFETQLIPFEHAPLPLSAGSELRPQCHSARPQASIVS